MEDKEQAEMSDSTEIDINENKQSDPDDKWEYISIYELYGARPRHMSMSKMYEDPSWRHTDGSYPGRMSKAEDHLKQVSEPMLLSKSVPGDTHKAIHTSSSELLEFERVEKEIKEAMKKVSPPSKQELRKKRESLDSTEACFGDELNLEIDDLLTEIRECLAELGLDEPKLKKEKEQQGGIEGQNRDDEIEMVRAIVESLREEFSPRQQEQRTEEGLNTRPKKCY